MGSSPSRPGCPPPSRWRGIGPQWDADLCNLGYKVVKSEDVPDATAIPATELVGEAFENAKETASSGVHEVQEVFEMVKKVGEIILIIALFMLMAGVLHFFYKLYRCSTRCFSSKRTDV